MCFEIGVRQPSSCNQLPGLFDTADDMIGVLAADLDQISWRQTGALWVSGLGGLKFSWNESTSGAHHYLPLLASKVPGVSSVRVVISIGTSGPASRRGPVFYFFA